MQDAIELTLSDNERAVLAEFANEAQAARRQLQDKLLEVDASMNAALAMLARLHGHKGGRVEVKDGRFYVIPAAEQERTEL